MKPLAIEERINAECSECFHPAHEHQNEPVWCKHITAMTGELISPMQATMVAAICGCEMTPQDVIADYVASERLYFPDSLGRLEALDAALGIRMAAIDVINRSFPSLYVEGFMQTKEDQEVGVVTVMIADGIRTGKFKFKVDYIKRRDFSYATYVLSHILRNSFRTAGRQS